MSTTASPSQMQEVLAFKLAYQTATTTTGNTILTPEAFEAKWRDNEDIRKAGYHEAVRFQAALQAAGMRVSTQSSARLINTLHNIMTVPPRLAYTLPGAAAFDQSDSK